MSATAGAQASDFGWFTVWVNQHLGLCLTFARGLSKEQMFGGFGLKPRHLVEETFEEAETQADLSGRPKIRVGERDGWAYAVEHFTGRGSNPQTLCRLSANGGEALALGYTQTISTFLYTASGELVNGFDLTVPHIRWGCDPHRFDTTMERAGFLGPGVPDPPAMGARFLQLTFGITIDQRMLEQALPGVDLG